MVEEASNLGEGPLEEVSPWVVASLGEREACPEEVAEQTLEVVPLAAGSFQRLFLVRQVREEDPLELESI